MNKIVQGSGGMAGGQKQPTIVPDTLVSEDMVEFTLGICEGPIGGLVNGAKNFYLDDTPLVSPTGTNNFSPFRLDVFHGDQNASVVFNDLGGQTSNVNVGVTLAQNTPVVRTTSSTLRNLIDCLEIRINFNQLVLTNTSGDQRENTAQFKVQYREAGTLTWNNLFDTETISLKGKTMGGYVKEFRQPVPRIAGDWEIRLTKISPDGDPYNIVVMSWESFQCVTNEARAYDNLALVKGLARASDQFTSIPEFAGVWAGKLILIPNNYDPLTRYYSGIWDGTFVLGHSDNPAWCAYDALMNPIYGAKRHYPSLICDRFTFYEAARWCDELIPRGDTGTFQPRYTYNDLIDTGRPGLDMARYIVAIFGGVLTTDLNQTVRLKIDKPTPISQVFGPESVTETGFQYQFSDISTRANDFTVSFVNPEMDWGTDVRQVKDDDLILRNGRIPTDFTAIGCIDVYEAQRRAYNMLLKGNTETMTVTFQTARQGLMLDIYDMISVSDPHMDWGLAGRVKSVDGLNIHLRDPLTVPVGTDMTLALQTPTGPVQLTVRSALAVTRVLTIQGAGVYPTNAPARAQFVLSSAEIGLAKPFRVVGIAPDTSNPDLFTITGLEYNANRSGDVDNMTSTAPQNYSGTLNKPVVTPVITNLASGVAHQQVNGDGTVTFRIGVELSVSPNLGGYVEIFYRRVDLEAFQLVTTTTIETYLPNVLPEVEYEVYAVSVSATGERSHPSASQFHTVSARAILPATPTGWTAVAGFDTITLTGPAHPDPDFASFRIYGATNASAALIYLDTVSTTNYVRRVPPGDTITRYKVSAVNRSGLESGATDFIAALPAPPTLAELDASVSNAIADAATSSDAAATAALQSATDAATSAGTAIDAANSALDYRNTAARMTSGGASLNPVFNDWTAAAPANVFVDITSGSGTFSKVTSGVRYVNALQMNSPAGPTNPGPTARISSQGSGLLASRNPGKVVVTAEIEYVSGSLSGTALRARWVGAATYPMAKLLTTELVAEAGRIQTVQWLVDRPEAYLTGGAPEFHVEVLTTSTEGGGTLAECAIRVHRLDFEVITATSMTSIFQQSAAKVDEIATATVGLRAVAGSAGAALELVALSDLQGESSIARISADNILLDGTVTSEHMNVSWLNAGRIQAQFIDVNQLLTIEDNAGMRYGKVSTGSDEIDGIFFGQDGTSFGLAASRTASGKRQSLKLTSTTGLQMLNARHFVSGAGAPSTTTVTTNLAKTDLPAGVQSIKISAVGGGAAGAGAVQYGRTIGAAGQPTIVRIYDGATLMHTVTAAGAPQTPTTAVASGGTAGQVSPITGTSTGAGAGGKGGVDSYDVGSNGAKAWVYGLGGKAGNLLTTEIDLSGYTAPAIEIVIGAGGPTSGNGAAGKNGQASYTIRLASDVPADILPIEPTQFGSFSKASGATGATVFPDFGPGLWVINGNGSAMNLGTIEVSGTQRVILNTEPSGVFVAAKRPNIVTAGSSNARTINYLFYSMTEWG